MKNIIIVVLIIIIGILFYSRNNTQEFESDILPADTFEQAELPSENQVGNEDLGDQYGNLNLSSYVYINQYAYIKSIRDTEDRQVVGIDVITDIVFSGTPEDRNIEIINQSEKIRNYVIDENTMFVDNPTSATHQSTLKDSFYEIIDNNENPYFMIDTSSNGVITKIVIPTAG